MKRRKLIIIAVILLFVFTIVNIVWFINWHKYNDYKNAVGYQESTSRYFTVDSEGFRYAVFPPDYMRFVGNLTVGNNVWGEEAEENTCSLIIWPLFTGGYEFGVCIYVPLMQNNNCASESYTFLLDEKGNNLSEALSQDEVDLLKENKELIQKVYHKAYDMWGIGTDELWQR